MCIDIVEMCFEIANGQIMSTFDRVTIIEGVIIHVLFGLHFAIMRGKNMYIGNFFFFHRIFTYVHKLLIS